MWGELGRKGAKSVARVLLQVILFGTDGGTLRHIHPIPTGGEAAGATHSLVFSVCLMDTD